MKVIEANHVYKVFGRRPSDGVKKLKAGRTRDQLRKSGQTAAVIDTTAHKHRECLKSPRTSSLPRSPTQHAHKRVT